MADAGFRVRIAMLSVWGVESPLIFLNLSGGLRGFYRESAQ